MISPFSFKQLLKKNLKTICLLLGSFYAVLGIFALAMIAIQSIVFANIELVPDEHFMELQNALYNVWIIFMPLLTILGCGYIAFGIFFNKIKTDKYKINLLLSILCLVWVIAYSISSIRFMELFFGGMPNDFLPARIVGYGFFGFGIVAVFAAMTVPQYIIGKRIKNQD
jgi:hypothetical protein